MSDEVSGMEVIITDGMVFWRDNNKRVLVSWSTHTSTIKGYRQTNRIFMTFGLVEDELTSQAYISIQQIFLHRFA